jgi:hypothetical protein
VEILGLSKSTISRAFKEDGSILQIKYPMNVKKIELIMKIMKK